MTSLKPGGNAKVSAQLRRTMQNAFRDDLIVTPLVDEFLAKNPDWTVAPWVAERLAKVMSTPPRDRRFSWSASQSGSCLRRQELTFLGVSSTVPLPPKTIRIFNNGTWIHYRWQALLLTAGILDDIEVGYKNDSHRSRCSMDGQGTARISRYKGMLFGFELKGRNDYTYSQQRAQNGPDEKTQRQVDFEFYLSGLDVFSIVNENKNTQDNTEWVFYRDQDRIRDVAQEVSSLNKAIDRMRLHPMIPECKRQLASGEFYKCPFGGKGGPCEMSGDWPTTTGKVQHGQSPSRTSLKQANTSPGSPARRVIRKRRA